jgi:cyclase
MLTSIRVIPVLSLIDSSVFKTCQFAEPRYIGDPVNAARIFNDLEVDEIIIQNIARSRFQSEPNYRLLETISSQCFMPATYGGGVSSFQQIERLLRSGFEKVLINSRNFIGFDVLEQSIANFGSQAIVVGVDYRLSINGERKVYSHSGEQSVDVTLRDYIQAVALYKPGELLLNCISLEGTMSGPDVEVAKEVCPYIDFPLTISGGVGCVSDIAALAHARVSAVAVSSLFLFWGKSRSVLINVPDSLHYRNR